VYIWFSLTVLVTGYNNSRIIPFVTQGRKIETNFNGNEIKSNLNINSINNRYKYIQSLINHFWSMWSFEYLKEIREYQRVKSKSKNILKIKVNEIQPVPRINIC